MRHPVSFRSLSIFHNSPDWRFQVIKTLDPVLRHYQRRYEVIHNKAHKTVGQYLLRFVNTSAADVEINPRYQLSPELNRMIDDLPFELRDKFQRIQHKQLRKLRQKKYILTTAANNLASNTEWRIKHLEDIDDQWVVKLIQSFSGVESNAAINTALRMKLSPRHEEVMRYIGYCIFLGKTDMEVSKQWEIPLAVIEAIRILFFDFSKLPKDTIAKMAYFRQLVVNGSYTEVDFNFFKLLDEMGETGLKAMTSFKLFNDEDKKKIEVFYGTSMLENVLRLKLAIRDSNDAMNYSNAINQLGTFFIKKAELKLQAAKTNNLETTTRKMETDMGNTVKGGNEHEKLLEAIRSMGGEIRELSLEEAEQPAYRPITELK